jgi:hypothetical protein
MLPAGVAHATANDLVILERRQANVRLASLRRALVDGECTAWRIPGLGVRGVTSESSRSSISRGSILPTRGRGCSDGSSRASVVVRGVLRIVRNGHRNNRQITCLSGILYDAKQGVYKWSVQMDPGVICFFHASLTVAPFELLLHWRLTLTQTQISQTQLPFLLMASSRQSVPVWMHCCIGMHQADSGL